MKEISLGSSGEAVSKIRVKIRVKSGVGVRTGVESLCLVCISFLFLDHLGGGTGSTECGACADTGGAWADEGRGWAGVCVGTGELTRWGDWSAVSAARGWGDRAETAGGSAVDASATDEAVLAPYGGGADCTWHFSSRIVRDILGTDACAGRVVGCVAVRGHVSRRAAGSATTGGRGETACSERVEKVECKGVLL